jgi:hypothetical protein
VHWLVTLAVNTLVTIGFGIADRVRGKRKRKLEQGDGTLPPESDI